MVQTFKDQFAGSQTDPPSAQLAAAFESKSVVYTSKRGTGGTFTMRWHADEANDAYHQDGGAQVLSGTLVAKASDVPAPDTRDSAKFENRTWSVKSFRRGHTFTRLRIEVTEQTRVGQAEARIQR